MEESALRSNTSCWDLSILQSCTRTDSDEFDRCNDKENDRFGYDSILSERALREIYLLPFMLAQKYAKPWAIMTSYDVSTNLKRLDLRFFFPTGTTV